MHDGDGCGPAAQRRFPPVLGAAFALIAAGCGTRGAATPPGGLARVTHAGELRWGADRQGGEPFVFEDPAHPTELRGFEVDLAAALARELGVKAALRPERLVDAGAVAGAGHVRRRAQRPGGDAGARGAHRLLAPLFSLRGTAGGARRRSARAPLPRPAVAERAAGRHARQLAGVGHADRRWRQPRPLRGGRRTVHRPRTGAHRRRAARRHHRRALPAPAPHPAGRRRCRRGAVRHRRCGATTATCCRRSIAPSTASSPAASCIASSRPMASTARARIGWRGCATRARPPARPRRPATPWGRARSISISWSCFCVAAVATLVISDGGDGAGDSARRAAGAGAALHAAGRARLPPPTSRWCAGRRCCCSCTCSTTAWRGLLPLDAWTAAIVGLGLNYAAYEAEIYRAGIQADPDRPDGGGAGAGHEPAPGAAPRS